MNDSSVKEPVLGDLSHEEMMSALFAHMVTQLANLAMMLLGKTPHPQTGQPVRDLEAARLFIDQLEMLEVKTKGNLTKPEEQLLKQYLTALRMAFVEAAGSAPAASDQPAAAEPKPAPTPAPESAAEAAEESKKKFSKKY